MVNFARIFGFSTLAEWACAARTREAFFAPEEIERRKELLKNIRNFEGGRPFSSEEDADDDLLTSGKMSPKEYKLYITQKIRSDE